MLGTGDAIQPRVVCLGADLTGGTNEKLRLAHTQYVVLDLNGHSLVITGGTAGAGIDTNVDGHLTIQDSNQGSNSLTVTGGPNSAGIGGTSGSGGFITISSGNVYAEGGSHGTGIGGGNGGAGGTITVDGGIIAAIGGTGAAGIGGGYYGSGGNISIRSGNISPTGGFGAAGIGSGYNNSNGPSGIDGGIITIDGGDLTATGGYGGAGIGGGYFCRGGTITISGGAITAIGGDGGAGIGSGGGSLGNGGSVSISGGAVNGRGGQWGAGIGGGDSGNGGNVSVTNGSVVATGGLDAAGIGGGIGGNGGNVTLSGGLIQSIRWVNTSAVIGSGRSGSLGGTLTVTTVNSTSWTNVNTAGSAGISPATSSTTTSNAAAAISVSRTEGYDYVTFAFKYAVSFDTGGGSSVAQQEVGYGQRPSQPTAPSRPGYAMDTWHTGSASGPTYNFTTGATITAATTLYASWNAITAAPLSINPGTRAVTITQTDRQVGSAWNVSVHSAPVTLGSGVTDGSAALIFSGTIPAVTAGVHHVEVSSTASNSVAAVQKLWFVCDQTGAIIGVYATEAEANAAWAALQPSAASLSSTGLTASAIIEPLTAAGLLLILGLVLIAWRRRKEIY